MNNAMTLWIRLPVSLRQLFSFGLVGVVGTLVDIGLFNVFVGGFGLESLSSKIISTTVAIGATWLGSRYITFRQHRRKALRESIDFFIASLLGGSIAWLCLWISHYVLGFTSLLADNISANVVGFVLGASFRFVAYKFWVYKPSKSTETK